MLLMAMYILDTQCMYIGTSACADTCIERERERERDCESDRARFSGRDSDGGRGRD